MGTMHLTMLANQARKRARKLEHKALSGHNSSLRVRSNTVTKSSSNNPEVEYEEIEVSAKITIWFKLADEVNVDETVMGRFSEYCEDEIGSNYTNKMTWFLSNHLAEISEYVSNLKLQVAVDDDDKVDLSPDTNNDIVRHIKLLTDKLESDLPWVMVHKNIGYMSHIRLDDRRAARIELETEDGNETLYYNYNVQRLAQSN